MAGKKNRAGAGRSVTTTGAAGEPNVSAPPNPRDSAAMRAVADRIDQVAGVSNARVWTKVEGKERIYFETVSKNGGKNWNGGVGYREAYLNARTGKVTLEGVAGAATRKWHEENRTAEKIEAAFR